MIRLEDFKYLLEVASVKSLTKAAENLFLAKSSVSMAIAKLESEFGTTLVERSAQGTVLTKNGELVVEAAEKVMRIIDDVKETINENELAKQKELYFLLDTSFSATVFSRAISELNKMEANKRIITKKMKLKDIYEAVNKDKNKFAIITKQPKTEKNYDNIVCIQLAEFDISMIISENSSYLSNDVEEVAWVQVKDIPMVEFMFGLADIDTTVAFSTDDRDLYYQAIADGIGKGFMISSEDNIKFARQRGLKTVKLKDAEKRKLYLVHHKNASLDTVEQYAAVLKKYIK